MKGIVVVFNCFLYRNKSINLYKFNLPGEEGGDDN
jgi:hypothetical protein